jgi:predicted nuclease of predicted toxin-antitoxin system
MSGALYMDEHVHRAVTMGLRLRGVDVLTVQEDGYRNTPDPRIVDHAATLGRVLFSQNEDMRVEAMRRQRDGIPFAGVIYAHQLQTNIGMCVRDLELIASLAMPEEMANGVEFLPL